MKKKVVSLLMAASMVVSLTACGNPEGNGAENAAPAADANTEAEAPAADTAATEEPAAAEEAATETPAEVTKPETIKVMWDGTIFKEGDNYAEDFYKALDEALGLHVEWIRPDHSTYAEQVGIAFTDESTLADVIILPSNYYASYAAQGSLWNMTDAWNNSETANSGRLTDIAPTIIDQWKTAGPDGQEGIYGM